MTESTKTLSVEARKLSPAERIDLVDDILASLDEPDSSIDGQWAKEAEDRMAAYRRGDLFEKRRRLMEAWGEYCASKSGHDAVVPMRAVG